MQESENLSYIPLEIEVVEVQMEKGYATSSNGFKNMPNEGYGW